MLWLKRVWCALTGHPWIITRQNRQKHIALYPLHPLAGCDARCSRCGEEWDDFWTEFDCANGFFCPDGAVYVQEEDEITTP